MMPCRQDCARRASCLNANSHGKGQPRNGAVSSHPRASPERAPSHGEGAGRSGPGMRWRPGGRRDRPADEDVPLPTAGLRDALGGKVHQTAVGFSQGAPGSRAQRAIVKRLEGAMNPGVVSGAVVQPTGRCTHVLIRRASHPMRHRHHAQPDGQANEQPEAGAVRTAGKAHTGNSATLGAGIVRRTDVRTDVRSGGRSPLQSACEASRITP